MTDYRQKYLKYKNKYSKAKIKSQFRGSDFTENEYMGGFKGGNRLADSNFVDDFLCPITYNLMVDPVTDSFGHNYEKSAIQEWFSRGHLTSPKTNETLPNTTLTENNDLNVEQLINEIKSVDKVLIQNISVFDIYQGNNIPSNKKSVSLSIVIQPIDKSLTDDDLEKLSSNIIDSVFKKFGAEIRSH